MSDASPTVIFTRWVEVPVYHRPRGWHTEGGHVVEVKELQDGRRAIVHRTYTGCGLVTEHWGWTEDPAERDWSRRFADHFSHDRGLVIRRDHAQAIGRPCRRGCFFLATAPE